MSSPITGSDFNIASFGGTECDRLEQLMKLHNTLKTWFDWAFDASGALTPSFLQCFAGQFVPVGSLVFMPVNVTPTGFLLANGQAVSRTLYDKLFDRYGTTFGIGDGATTFNLPNMQDRCARGWGVNATGQVVGEDQDSFQLSLANLVEHSHYFGVEGSSAFIIDSQPGRLRITGAGSGVDATWVQTDTTTVGVTRPEGDAEPQEIIIDTIPKSITGLWLVKF